MRRQFLSLLLVLAPFANAYSKESLAEIAYEQKPGAILRIGQAFRDEAGATTTLENIIDNRPFVFILGYYHCANLCGVVRSDLFGALRQSGLVAGEDYALAALSIDPTETSADASAAKASDVARFPAPGAADHWRFLTGESAGVQAVSDAVGFHARADPKTRDFPHPVGVVFVTAGGVVSSYLLGVGYRVDDVRAAIARAARGEIAPVASPVLLLCYDVDPATGTRSLSIMKSLRLATAGIVLVAIILLVAAHRRERRRA